MIKKSKIGIMGIGMVGKQICRYFEEIKELKRGKNLFLYDIDPKKAFSDDVNKADVIFVCVPSPRNPDGSCNISAIDSVFQMIKEPKIMVIKSTVPPGTTEMFQKKYPKHKVLFNPEFLTESQAWEDMIKPDRQIVGFTKKSLDAAHYVLSLLPQAPFMSPWGSDYKKYMVTATEAEIAKVCANAFFSTKVTFANQVADICEYAGADYENVKCAIESDYRIGPSHLNVMHGNYRGFGGYCLPKDIDALIMFLKASGLNADFFETIRKQNIKLLARQGFTINQISTHDKDIKLS
ncbi:hypothetical protein ACFL3E_02550 [Patescibacteria group bacterium]